MVQSKHLLFEKDLQKKALLFKALSHPARLAILNYLAETRVCFMGDISRELPLSRTTVNQHLSELKKAGLIKGNIEGVNTRYCINPQVLSEASKLSREFFDQLDQGGVNC